MKDIVTKAPFRWAGSKRKLLNEMLKTFDFEKEVYVEPFLGSGVVLLNVLENQLYKKYYVSDINSNLITFYSTLKNRPKELINRIQTICREYNRLSTLEEKCEYYYKIRKSFNGNRIQSISRSAFFWFLMKAGYNGVYRINSKGLFNVPCGKRERLLCDEGKMMHVAKLIQNVEFFCQSYDDFINEIMQREDANQFFVYCDPPYIPETESTEKHVLYTMSDFNHIGFVNYLEYVNNETEMSIMISMSKTKLSEEIYGKNFLNRIDVDDIIRSVNPKKKITSKEVALKNYL